MTSNTTMYTGKQGLFVSIAVDIIQPVLYLFIYIKFPSSAIFSTCKINKY